MYVITELYVKNFNQFLALNSGYQVDAIFKNVLHNMLTL